VSEPAPERRSASSDPVLSLEGVSVRFRVPQERIASLKEYAVRLGRRRVEVRDFWAVRDVSLSVNRGEVFGIVGRNGAGKSTLLKVVARVLRPTRGRVWVQGRVAPLLDLGGAFHPELTGRENVFLNGTLLGLSRREIARNFDRIVSFADVGTFIDAPLRTYSAGMVGRLGFAIATDVRPDVLIVDEILAVGDAEFQAKSAARIQAFQDEGTTVLMASHGLHAVTQMCTRAAWIDQGRIRVIGAAADVVRAYEDRDGVELAGVGRV
jgi:homopolymeric O-antigen transport system ATP-binding protein